MADTNTQVNTEPKNGGNDAQGGGNGSEKTFTQAELDSIVGKSKKQARESALKAFFEEKGISAEEADNAIAEFLKNKQPLDDSGNTNELQSQLDAANKARTKAVIEQKATVEAIKQNVAPDNVSYVLKMADFSDVINDKGEVDGEKLTAAVSKVLEDIPALKKPAADKGGFKQIGGDGKSDGNDKSTQAKPTPQKRWNKWNRI